MEKRTNQSIDNIPNTITHLTLEESFEGSINNLPFSITNLIVKCDILLGFIPYSVTHLTLGKCFNQNNIILPFSVTHLTIYVHYQYGEVFTKYKINWHELCSIQTLIFMSVNLSPETYKIDLENLPQNIKYLELPFGKEDNPPVGKIWIIFTWLLMFSTFLPMLYQLFISHKFCCFFSVYFMPIFIFISWWPMREYINGFIMKHFYLPRIKFTHFFINHEKTICSR